MGIKSALIKIESIWRILNTLTEYFFSDNGFFTVGTEDGEIYVWETVNFSLFKKYDLQTSSITAIIYSPDGMKLAVGSSDKIFQILDIHTGMPVFIKTLKSSVCSLKWSKFLLVIGCEDGYLLVWDIFEVKLIEEFKAHSGKFCNFSKKIEHYWKWSIKLQYKKTLVIKISFASKVEHQFMDNLFY